MTRLRLLFQNPAMAHYRVEFFRRLFLSPGVDLKLVLNRESTLYPGQRPDFSDYSPVILNTETNRRWRRDLFRLQMTAEYDCLIASLPLSQPSLLGFLATRLRRKPLIYWTEIWWTATGKTTVRVRMKTWIREALYRWLVRRASAIVVEGSSARDFHLALGIPDGKIFVANHSSEDLSLTHPTSSKLPGDEPTSQTLLYASRLTAWKGADILIRAFAEVEKERTDIQLVMVGDGPLRSRCEALIARLGTKRIKMVGAVPHREVGPYFADADAFVLPNTGDPYPEAWGLVLNEAAGMSLPILCTPMAGAVKDLVEHGVNGLIVPPRDPHALAEAILRLFKDPTALKQMGQRSRERFDAFNSFDKMARGFEDAALYACRGRRPSS